YGGCPDADDFAGISARGAYDCGSAHSRFLPAQAYLGVAGAEGIQGKDFPLQLIGQVSLVLLDQLRLEGASPISCSPTYPCSGLNHDSHYKPPPPPPSAPPHH